MYVPDKWAVVFIDSHQPHYKVYASWSGSYLFGSSWRMNSGIVTCDDTGDRFNFKGHSGSVYSCGKGSYGVTADAIGVLNSFIKRGEIQKTEIRIMPEDTDWVNLDWIIKDE